MKFMIMDLMTGRYYCGGSPRLPMMGGSRDEATPFPDRASAADAMRQFPETVIARVVDCFCSDGGGFVCTACKETAGEV